jgi:hypothetical protein
LVAGEVQGDLDGPVVVDRQDRSVQRRDDLVVGQAHGQLAAHPDHAAVPLGLERQGDRARDPMDVQVPAAAWS